MKYKRQIITSALAFSLLIGTPSVFAASLRDIGIKEDLSINQKQKNSNKEKRRNRIVGTIITTNKSGFILEVKNKKRNISTDVKIDENTSYSKNGLKALSGDISLGQKVIVIGNLDKTTNVISAKNIKIVPKAQVMIKTKNLVLNTA